jgi:predicted tellurium resistance membrane protein TerC
MIHLYSFLNSNLWQTIFICFGIAIVWIIIMGLFRKKDDELKIDMRDE